MSIVEHSDIVVKSTPEKQAETIPILNEAALINHALQFITHKPNQILLLIGFIRAKVSLEFIKSFLNMSDKDIQDAINQDVINFDTLNTGKEKFYNPLHSRKKRNSDHDWSMRDLQILAGLWLLQAPTDLISILLSGKKLSGSIYYRRKKLGLPARKKLKTLTEFSEDMLSWEDASLLSSSSKANKFWPVRNSDKNHYVTANTRGAIIWTSDLIMELSNRWWSNQHPDEIAKEFAVSPTAIKSMAHWISLPKRERSKLVSDYNPKLAQENCEKAGYTIRKCVFNMTRILWTKKCGGERISLRSKRSKKFNTLSAAFPAA